MTGSITRATPNIAAGAISVYFTVPGALPDGSSITFFKTPGQADNPLDVRLRTKGLIDVKMQDGTIADTSELTWKAGRPSRGDLVWTWVPIVGGIYGLLSGNVLLYFKGNGEYGDADDVLSFSGVTTAPTNFAHGSPNASDPVQFEVERVWNKKVIPGPYGTPPPAPPLNPATTLVRPGVAGNTWAMFSVYSGDAQIFDTVDLNLSLSSGMTSPTLHSGGVHNTGGFNLFTVTGLTANTPYFAQAVLNGLAHGPVASLKTTRAAGTPCTITRAIGGCQRSAPASTASFLDMVGQTDGWIADRLVHLGDDTYPSTLTPDPFDHWASYALSMSDDWAQLLAANGVAMNKIISDHDDNGTGQSNLPNENDPITAASVIAWAAAVPAPMTGDSRVPKIGRYWSEVEGNVRFVYLDQRTTLRTDVRKNASPPDDPTSYMIDTVQEQWLYDEASAAATAGQLLIVFMDTAFLGVSPYATEGNKIPVSYSDKWPSYTAQRDRIDETLASIMPITGDHPNCEIWHSDSHALQFGVTANGIKVRCCGPMHQQLHAHYQSDYDVTYPPNTAGDQYGGGGTNTAWRMQYMRQTITETVRGTWVVTADMRQCSPAVVGDTPTTPHTDSTTYSISGDVVGDHLYSMPGVPS